MTASSPPFLSVVTKSLRSCDRKQIESLRPPNRSVWQNSRLIAKQRSVQRKKQNDKHEKKKSELSEKQLTRLRRKRSERGSLRSASKRPRGGEQKQMLSSQSKCNVKQKLRLDDWRGSKKALVPAVLEEVPSTASETLHLPWMNERHLLNLVVHHALQVSKVVPGVREKPPRRRPKLPPLVVLSLLLPLLALRSEQSPQPQYQHPLQLQLKLRLEVAMCLLTCATEVLLLKLPYQIELPHQLTELRRQPMVPVHPEPAPPEVGEVVPLPCAREDKILETVLMRRHQHRSRERVVGMCRLICATSSRWMGQVCSGVVV